MHNSKIGRYQKMKNTKIISDIVQYGYNSGLGYGLSNFTNILLFKTNRLIKEQLIEPRTH